MTVPKHSGRQPRHAAPARPRAPADERGVILLFALIALVVLLIGAAALIRSFNTSLFQAGNIGFKRDLQNQGERAVSQALAAFGTGSGAVLPTRAARANNYTGVDAVNHVNYSAQVLSVDAQGVPDVLTRNDGTDQTTGYAINPGNDFQSDDGTVTIRYVVDRLCATTGDEKTLGTTQCAVSSTPPKGNSGSAQQNNDSNSLGAGLVSATPVFVLYRVSARITGPRNTQSFFQSTFSVPS